MRPRGYYQHRTGTMRTSENTVHTKFAEFVFYELR
jgi:hypothetical protein